MSLRIGGLRPESDLDLLIIVNRPMAQTQCQHPTRTLLQISAPLRMRHADNLMKSKPVLPRISEMRP